MELTALFDVGVLISKVYKGYDTKEELKSYLQECGWEPVGILNEAQFEQLIEKDPNLAKVLEEGNEAVRKHNEAILEGR